MAEPRRTDIPLGKDNAVTRQYLSWLWRKTDRHVRKQIEQFRQDPDADDVIISHSDGKGYWRSKDVEEIKGYKAEIDSRINSLHILSMAAYRIIENLTTDVDETQCDLPF